MQSIARDRVIPIQIDTRHGTAKHPPMRGSLLLWCLVVWTVVLRAQDAAGPAEKPAARLTVTLSDGSRITGAPDIDRLKITTSYATPEIPLTLLHTVEFGAGADRVAKITLQNGDVLNAGVTATEIAMKAGFGHVVIPMADVSTMEMARGTGAGKPLPEGCVLHYIFPEDEGGKVTDSSDSGNDGTVKGASFVTVGRAAGAMSFNGRGGQAIIVKNAANLKMQDFTIMAWIKRGRSSRVTYNAPMASFGLPRAMIFGYGQGGYNLGIQDDGELFMDTGAKGVFSSCKITDEDFHQVAVTKKGKSIVFYVDGVAYPAEDYDVNFEFNTDAAVGAEPGNLGANFVGLIDEVAVFSRPLTVDEVKGVYESQK